jgi:hypothetical protein
MSFYTQEKAAMCHDVPCYISGFSVAVTSVGGGVYRFTVTDNCTQVTSLKMLSAITRKALDMVIAARSLAASNNECGCCRNGSGASFNLDGKYMQIALTGSVTNATYTVVPPFAAG